MVVSSKTYVGLVVFFGGCGGETCFLAFSALQGEVYKGEWLRFRYFGDVVAPCGRWSYGQLVFQNYFDDVIEM